MYSTQRTTSNRKHGKAPSTSELQCFSGSLLKRIHALEKCRLGILYSRCQNRLWKDAKRNNSHEQKVQPAAQSGTIEVDKHNETKVKRSFLLLQVNQEKIRGHELLLLSFLLVSQSVLT